MINIFKNLKNYAGFVVMIVALLLVQAFCDLSLPDYTSDIVNVGISQYGIENGILDVIDEDSMNALCMFVSEEDEKFILDSYTKYDNTKDLPSSVKKEYKNYEDYNIIYKLNTDNEEDIKRLKDILYPVEMISYMLTADSEEAVSIKADENSGVAWFSQEEALKKSTEPWFVENVYSKLIQKSRCFK